MKTITKEHRKRLSDANKGKKLSEEHKRKISEALKGRQSPKKGIKTKPLSEETKRKISEALRGEKSSSWKGGITYDPYPYDWTDTLRESIRQRDDYVCQECGIHQDELNKRLDIHHIDYDKDNCCPNNLISLCNCCHSKTNFNREYWIKYWLV